MAGVAPIDVWDWTWGELAEAIQAYHERLRRERQGLAVIAYQQAGLTARHFGGKGTKLPAVWEAFPFWSEEETRAMQLEKYRAIMRRHKARDGRR
ncbi:MAG: hypothetical protein LUH36_08500 [Oscillospiraceae bacterium]|nr:hypothetical protein [Oscillospiraceae bacterium]